MKNDVPILIRLGPVPFWRGREKCLSTLEEIYHRARDRATASLAANPVEEKPSKKKRIIDK